MSAIAGYSIGAALHEVGLLPPETTHVEIHFPADGAAIIRYEIHVTEENLPKLEKALRLVREGIGS